MTMNIDRHAFMEFKQELWSADSKRFTILFDPGRIKRGVSTNLEHGPALLKGNRYKLSVSGRWQDVYGQELSINTTKEFEVGTAYRHHLKVEDWLITKPIANSSTPLTIRFDRILDHALLHSMIRIEDGENNLLIGHWEISEMEQSIQFIPEKRWKKGNYQVIIDSRIEDISGNNLQNLLDYKKASEENNYAPYQYLNFEI